MKLGLVPWNNIPYNGLAPPPNDVLIICASSLVSDAPSYNLRLYFRHCQVVNMNSLLEEMEPFSRKGDLLLRTAFGVLRVAWVVVTSIGARTASPRNEIPASFCVFSFSHGSHLATFVQFSGPLEESRFEIRSIVATHFSNVDAYSAALDTGGKAEWPTVVALSG